MATAAGTTPGVSDAGVLARSDEETRDDEGRAGLPPGPRAHPFLQTLVWAFAPTWLMDRCSERIGDAFTFTFWPSGIQFVMVSDPELVKTVFTAPPEVAPSATASSPLAPIVGHSSVLTLIGPEHMRQRK